MDCDLIRPLLSDVAAGAATDDECAVVERHLAEGCAECHAELSELQEAAATLLAVEDSCEPPPSLRAQLLDAIADGTPAVAPQKPKRSKATLVALAIAATIALVAGTMAIKTSDVQEGVNEAFDAWRDRVAKSERELGVRGARLVSLPVDAFQNSVVTHVLYDSLSGQLHVWATHGPLAAESEPNWAWLVDQQGAVLARGQLRSASVGRLVAVLDVDGIDAPTVKVLLTIEGKTPPDTPRGEVVDQGVLQLR